MSAAAEHDRPLREVAIAYALVTAATVALGLLGGAPPLDAYLHVAVAVVFLGTALQLAQRTEGGVERYGLALGGLLEPPSPPPAGLAGSLLDLGRALRGALPSALRELSVALALCALIFPPFVLGFYLFHQPERPFVWLLPTELPSYLLAQLFVVALPEEALFRGYVQGRLSDAFPRRHTLLGVSLSVPAWLGQALLFALIHLTVEPHPSRLAVFFPGLLFGWLRERRGGIGAAVVLHAASNLLGDVLARGWL
jgi:membrane protease YdiL (CAAX protease family)